jgi:DNA ligase (NAD+)
LKQTGSLPRTFNLYCYAVPLENEMIQEMSIVEQKALFLRASAIYHSGGGEASPISDSVFDELKRSIRQEDPRWMPLLVAGWRVNKLSPLQKAAHAGFMGSIYNAADYASDGLGEEERWVSGMQIWMDRAKSERYYATLKVDGLSVGVEYNDGEMQVAITRGDCLMGENVTHHMQCIIDCPAVVTSKAHFVVRGEVVLFTNVWTKFQAEHPEYKAARNAAAGMLGRKDTSSSHLLRFLVHGLDILDASGEYRPTTMSYAMDWLKEIGFTGPVASMITNIEEAQDLHLQMKEHRGVGNLPYEIDGIVFCVNDLNKYKSLGIDSGRCPRGAVAWKFPTQKATTKFLGVDVSVGHSGKLTPTAMIEPVTIGSVTVQRASLSNWELISAMDLRIGDIVEVERCGDVIPGIIGVAKSNGGEPVTEPSTCPVCGGSAGRRTLAAKKKGQAPPLSSDTFCLNPDCEAKSTGKINKWVSDTNMLGVGPAIVEAMVEDNLISDPADLYLLTLVELGAMKFGKAAGPAQFGIKRATSVIEAISGKKIIPLNMILGALGVQGLGEGIAKQVREKMPGHFDKLEDWVNSTKLCDFGSQVGLPNIANTIHTALWGKRTLVNKLLAAGVRVEDPTPQIASGKAAGPLAAKIFCLTGGFPEQKAVYHDKIAKAGGGVEDDVRSNVTHVVVFELPAPGKETGKASKAIKRGLPLIDLKQLTEMLS